MSVENQIHRTISNYKRGKIFFPDDFKNVGSSTAVRQALSRLEEKGILLRLSQGIYLYPKKHKLLGILEPSIEEIAVAIAKRDNARIIPTGAQALNKLGLSTQVPMNTVYLTDGTPRNIKIGRRNIKFKIASPKLLSVKSDINILIIQALREVGKENINSELANKFKELLSKVDNNIIKHDFKLAPSWIADFIKSSLNKSDE
jgi:predicted transcriptional regulator of viral defense system